MAIRAALASHHTVLAAWEHHKLPNLAVALGAPPAAVPEEWPGDDFDTIFVLEYDSEGAISFSTDREGFGSAAGRRRVRTVSKSLEP